MKVILGFPFQWAHIGNVLKIQGNVLAEGTWTGLDGEPIYYPRTIIGTNAEDLVGRQVKYLHSSGAESVCGFITAVRTLSDRVEAESIIFGKEAIQGVLDKRLKGYSMESEVETEFNSEKEVKEAKEVKYKFIALVENPACDIGVGISPVGMISLGKKEENNLSTEEEYWLLYQKPSKEEFFDWVEKRLKAAGVPEDAISKVIEVLKAAVKVPYPYPYPTAYPGPEAKKGEEFEGLEGFEELAKPTKTAFFAWFEKQLKEAGISEEELAKMMRVVRKAIKVPYPYPELEKKLEEAEGELQKKKDEVTSLTAQLETAKTELDGIKKEKIADVIKEVKKVDSSFDEKSLLTGIEDLDVQKKLLESYLATAVRLSKPFTTEQSVDLDEASKLVYGKPLTQVVRDITGREK